MKFLTILAISVGLLTASQAMEKPSFHTGSLMVGLSITFFFAVLSRKFLQRISGNTQS